MQTTTRKRIGTMARFLLAPTLHGHAVQGAQGSGAIRVTCFMVKRKNSELLNPSNMEPYRPSGRPACQDFSSKPTSSYPIVIHDENPPGSTFCHLSIS
jgi:hypothetical protein